MLKAKNKETSKIYKKILLGILILCGILSTQSVFSNDTTLVEKHTHYYITCKYHYGFLMPHVKAIEYFIDSHIQGCEVNVGLKTDGSESWSINFKNPEVGLGFYYSSLGNDEIFGRATAIFLYAKNTLLGNKPESVFNLSQHLGAGVSYITKKHDLNSQYFTYAIGSHFNVYVNYSLDGSVKLNKNMLMLVGAGLYHFSNGNVTQPNKGYNVFLSTLGLKYMFAQKTSMVYATTRLPFVPHNQFNIILAPGIKKYSWLDPKSYYATTITMDYGRHFKEKGIWGAGVDLCYDQSMKVNPDYTVKSNMAFVDYFKLGVYLSYEIYAERIGFVYQPSVYVLNKYTEEHSFYNRIGIKYYVRDNLSLNVNIKAKWIAIADYIEWGVGYTIGN
jgi:hypothetical protein